MCVVCVERVCLFAVMSSPRRGKCSAAKVHPRYRQTEEERKKRRERRRGKEGGKEGGRERRESKISLAYTGSRHG